VSDRFIDVQAWDPTDAEYYSDNYVGSTTLGRALGKDVYSDGEFGIALHIAVLQPDLFPKRVITKPAEVSKGSGKGQKEREREWLDTKAKGKIVLSDSDHATILAMRDAVRGHEMAARLLKQCEAFEQSYRCTDAITGLRCRVRPDGHGTIERQRFGLDLKSAEAPDFDSFQGAVARYRYHVQAAFYCDVLDIEDWYWPVVGKKRPHRVGLYKCPPQWLELGRRLYRAGLTIVAHDTSADHPRAWWEAKAHELEPPKPWVEQEADMHEHHADDLLSAVAAEFEQDSDGDIEHDDQDETSDEPAGWAAEEATT
jgi:hypothetical protein